MSADQRFTAGLGYDADRDTAEIEGRECLVEVATTYGIIRNFKTDEPRLAAAYEVVRKQAVPPTRGNHVQIVENLMADLQREYGKNLPSAASKFLWMRFRSPIIIFDQIAYGWLRKRRKYKDDTYENYCKAWLEEYDERKEGIRIACSQVAKVKKFTLASQVDDKILNEWTSSDWFRERVFDHFMLNATELEKS